MINLRDYQIECNQATWDSFSESSSLVVLPTGAGKTVCFVELLRRAISALEKVGRQFKCVILVNRTDLLSQTQKIIAKELGQDNVGIFCGTFGEKTLDTKIVVATIQSIYDINIKELNFIILDEAHECDQDKGRYFDFIAKNKHEKLKVIGYTATPYRANGGLIYGKDKLFAEITYKKELTELIEAGWLVKPRLKHVEHQFDVSGLKVVAGEYKTTDVEKLTGDKNKMQQQITDALARMIDRKKIAWACSSINHCEAIAEELELRGEKVSIIHSKLDSKEKSENKALFEEGDSRHICFVSMLTQGYDYPPIDCIVLIRPIRSPVLYVQTVGRGLRPAPGKTDLLVLDYGKVIQTLGPLDDPTLKKGNLFKQKNKEKLPPNTMKYCKSCFEYNDRNAPECSNCGAPFAPSPESKLTSKPTQGYKLLSGGKPNPKTTVEVFDVKTVTIDPHYISKTSGRNLFVISYVVDSKILGALMTEKEYLATEPHWALSNLKNRLIELGFNSLPSHIHMSTNQTAPRIPRQLEKKIKPNAKFPKYTLIF